MILLPLNGQYQVPFYYFKGSEGIKKSYRQSAVLIFAGCAITLALTILPAAAEAAPVADDPYFLAAEAQGYDVLP